MTKGKYIIIEGCDGSGKTSLLRKLQEEYPNFVYVREPGDLKSEASQHIRAALLQCEPLSSITETHLFIADRSILLPRIKKLIEEGFTVVSDRSVCSSIVYQSFKLLSMEEIIKLNEHVIHEPIPNHIVVLNIDIKDFNKRMKNKALDRIEQKSEKYFAQVIHKYKLLKDVFYRTGYIEISDAITYLNSARTIDQTYAKLKQIIFQ